MAPLTTVVNTFGGTRFDKDWKARLDSPEFEKTAGAGIPAGSMGTVRER
jgi:sorbitol/mannitol transport system substrate-binding protein